LDIDEYINGCDDPWDLKKIGENSRVVKLLGNDIGRVGRVIDIGGGCGFYADALRRMGNSVTVLDRSNKMVDEGKKMFPYVSFINGGATRMPFPDHSFNAAVCMGTLMYIKDRDKFFSEVHRILKTNGLFFLYERNRHDILNMLVRLVKKTEKSIDNPSSFLVKSEIRELAMEHGFLVRKIGGGYSNFLVFLLVKK